MLIIFFKLSGLPTTFHMKELTYCAIGMYLIQIFVLDIDFFFFHQLLLLLATCLSSSTKNHQEQETLWKQQLNITRNQLVMPPLRKQFNSFLNILTLIMGSLVLDILLIVCCWLKQLYRLHWITSYILNKTYHASENDVSVSGCLGIGTLWVCLSSASEGGGRGGRALGP